MTKDEKQKQKKKKKKGRGQRRRICLDVTSCRDFAGSRDVVLAR